MFSVGPEELKGLDDFREEWIAYLIDLSSDRATELLLEACLEKGLDYLSEIAKRKYGKHPRLFKYACQELLKQNRFLECEKLGLEALDLLSEDLVIRGKVANLIAQAAQKLNHQESLQCA